MKRLTTILVLGLSGFLFCRPVSAQNVRIGAFSELENVLSRQTDTVYVINFWATWCGPCVKEMPYFQELEAKYKGEKVKLLLVSLDFPDKTESKVLPFLRKRKIESEVLVLDAPDANEWIDKVETDWQGNIPVTLIFRADKNRRQFIDGETDFKTMSRIVKDFLE